MKKFILFMLFLNFLYAQIVFADDNLDIDKWDIKCNEAKNSKTVKACEANVKFCWTDEYKKYSGCFFDKTDPLYGTTSLGADEWDDEDWKKPSVNDSELWLHQHGYYLQTPGKTDAYPTADTITDSLYYKGSPNDAWLNLYGMTFRIYKNIPVSKSYSGVDDNDKVASIGCYMGYAKVRKNHKVNQFYKNDEMINPYETMAFDIVPEKCDYKKEQDCMGPVLVFKTFTAYDNNSCFAEFSRIILPTTFNVQDKYASTNLLKTSIAKDDNLKSAYIVGRNLQKEPTHGLYMTPWYVIGKGGNNELSIDSSCKENNDFCLKDLNRITTYEDAHASGRMATSWGFNIDANLGIYDSAAVLNPDNPQCPEYFFIDPNESDYNYRFKLSNNKNDAGKRLEELDWIQRLFAGSSNGSSYQGCVSQDEEGFKQIKECIEKETKKINETSCPNNNDFAEFTQNLKSIQSKCKSDYKENDLYARFLMIEDNKVFDEQIKDAVRKKIDECYDKKCNITEDERTKINNELKKPTYSLCKDGCPTITHYEYSDSPNAQCWMCGAGNDVYYTWTDSSNASGCHPESKPKEECFGTHEQQSCIKCMKNAYSAIGLDEEKIKCMDENWAAKEQQKMEADETIGEQSDEYTDESSQSNAERASDTHTHYSIGLNGNGFGSDGDDCKSFLGENISKIVKASFTTLRIAGAIIAIVNAMMSLIPAVVSKNADALKKASKKCVTMGIVLAAIGILPSIVILIARIFGYDISCLM